MWPKALSQLVELAPHVTRLLPLADRYFKDKSNTEDATRKAIEDLQENHRAALDSQRATVTDLTDRLRADLGGISSQQTTQATHTAALQRQIADLDQKLAGITRPVAELEKHLVSTRTDALAAKQATESLEGRLARMEGAQRRTQTLLVLALVLITTVLVLLVIVSLHTH